MYRQFCDLVGRPADEVLNASDIPHLPISLYKTSLITTGVYSPEEIFESSTTTGQIPSRHAVFEPELYLDVTEQGFNAVFGKPVSAFKWFGLLPSYLERSNASLVYMVRHFISLGGCGFYIDQYENLEAEIMKCEESGTPTVLIGVSFALLEFCEAFDGRLNSTRVIETGGMKGRREEMTRSQLHKVLKDGLGVEQVYSEYGMTELLSQGWTKGEREFYCAPTLRVQIREIGDPFSYCPVGVRGAVNCTDLANVDSCAFIATDDAGVVYADGSFEIIGRLDGSEVRGCNLMFVER